MILDKHYKYKENLIRIYSCFDNLVNKNYDIIDRKDKFRKILFPEINSGQLSLCNHVAKITRCIQFAKVVDSLHPKCGRDLYTLLENERVFHYGVIDSDGVLNNSYRGRMSCKNDCFIHTLAVDVYAQHLVFLWGQSSRGNILLT